MIRPLILAFAATLALAGAAEAQQRLRVTTTTNEQRAGEVRVPQGTAETIRTDQSFTDMVVGDPDIADVVPLTNRSLYVLGKKLGRTTVSLYDASRTLLGTINLEVSYDTSRLGQELRRRLPNARIEVSSINGRIMLSGMAPDAVAVERAVGIARQFGPDVINNITITRPQQVLLEVRFIEAQRTNGRELSINWNLVANRVQAATTTGLLTGNAPFGTVLARLLDGGVQADALVQALEERGIARRLAEPNLVALSGETANFLAGGEFPIPVQAENGSITVQFKRFGVGLAFTPTVLGHNTVNLRIEPEVSEVDPTTSVRFGNVQIPGLTVRRASTTIELKDGQSFAIAGLLQSLNNTTMAQLPWIGDVPILGALFRSTSFQRRETDLVIIVTPRLVQPAAAGVALRTPLDGSRRGNDADIFLSGRSEVPLAQIRAEESAQRGVRRTGHILDLTPGGTRAVR